MAMRNKFDTSLLTSDSGIGRYLTKVLEFTGIPGGAVTLSNAKGTASFVAGKKAINDETFITHRSNFRCCGLGRFLIAVVMLRFVDEGVVSLEQNIGDLLPEIVQKGGI